MEGAMVSETLSFKMGFERELQQLIDKYLTAQSKTLQWCIVCEVLEEKETELAEECDRRFPEQWDDEETDVEELSRLHDEERALGLK
ncbi:hypothetical protein A1D31_22215 [Bradyrhizobium liaoningense]|nr:hypothetical protein A1D31_22215 [Bradyrhizobium liaoningense]